MPAAHHRERVRVVEQRGAGQERDRLLAGVDQVLVPGVLGRLGSHAEDAVLAVEDHLAVGRHEVRHQHRLADAEIDEGALGDVPGDAPGDLVAGEPLFHG